MSEFEDLVGKELTWERVKGQKAQYELRGDSGTVATLSLEKSGVRGAFRDERWNFSREGFFRPRLVIRKDGEDKPVATLEVGAIGSGRLAMSNGKTLQWVQRGLFSSTWGFVSEDKEPLVLFKLDSGLLSVSATFSFQERAKTLQDAPLLAVLGWYVLVLYAEDAAPAGL